jgi:hypothetical protein
MAYIRSGKNNASGADRWTTTQSTILPKATKITGLAVVVAVKDLLSFANRP